MSRNTQPIRRYWGLVLGILMAGLPLHCLAADFTIMVEDAAEPFSRADGTGYANDLVKAAFQAVGDNVHFDVVPYARCKKSAEDGKTVACFSMSWYRGVENLVMFSAMPVIQVHADIFLNRKSPARIAGLGDIKGGNVVGIVNEYEYPEEINALRSKGAVLQSAPNDGANLRMLARGRIEAAVVMTNDLVSRTQKATEAGVEGEVTFAFRAGVENGFVGFSRKNPLGERARQQFDAGYKKIIADGAADAIKRRWTAKAAQ